jgi:hypothetical protein
VKRGQPLFIASCGSCHAANATGTPKAPNLIRSRIVRHDKDGSAIAGVIMEILSSELQSDLDPVYEAKISGLLESLKKWSSVYEEVKRKADAEAAAVAAAAAAAQAALERMAAEAAAAKAAAEAAAKAAAETAAQLAAQEAIRLENEAAAQRAAKAAEEAQARAAAEAQAKAVTDAAAKSAFDGARKIEMAVILPIEEQPLGIGIALVDEAEQNVVVAVENRNCRWHRIPCFGVSGRRASFVSRWRRQGEPLRDFAACRPACDVLGDQPDCRGLQHGEEGCP